MNEKKDTLIIMPAYNEEASIGTFLEKLLSAGVTDYADILVINDASSDSTEQILMEKKIAHLSHPFNLGYGTALQSGYKYAVKEGYSYVIQIDSDGQHDVANVDLIHECLVTEHDGKKTPDLVIGSRFLDGSVSFKISWAKKIAIHFFRTVIRRECKQKITDPTSGLQGLSYPVFEYYSHFGNFDNNYPDSNMIIQMALLGFQIQEIPAIMHKRTSGRSMHFGILNPMIYVLVMLLSTTNIYLRYKYHLLPIPEINKGGPKSYEN
ncbi:MAG: glycosyltransferase family 2 protein [Lachnospiraceae bacterium]|nr:glycosyltransferase family 2 protein [Lachnospiraceae bacterium]